MNKLYEVQITIRTVVQAEDYLSAHSVACNCKHEIIGEIGLGDIVVLDEIQKGQTLPNGWKEDFYPYGEGEQGAQQTIVQVWAEQG